MFRIYKIVLLILFVHQLSAQIPNTNYKVITGSIVDSISNEVLPGVTVAILSDKQKIVSGYISNEQGQFSASFIPGSRWLRCTIVGYRPIMLDLAVIDSSSRLPLVVKMVGTSLLLREITFTAKKEIVEYHIDKQIVNLDRVPGSPTNVLDALQKTGVIEVNPATKTVTFNGGESVRVLLDGKPELITEMQLAQIPVQEIEKVELSSMPSSRYDAEGGSGIINLVSRRTLGDYLNGALTINASSQRAIYGSYFMNFNNSPYNIFLIVTDAVAQSEQISTMKGETQIISNPYNIRSESNFSSATNINSVRGGIDYFVNESNQFSIVGTWSGNRNTPHSISQDNVTYLNNSGSYSFGTLANGESKNPVVSISGNYKNKINQRGAEVTADIYYSKQNYDAGNAMEFDYSDQVFPDLQNTTSKTKNHTFFLASDYINPAPSGKYEAGIKVIQRERDSRYIVDNYDYSASLWRDINNNSNEFDYTEVISAAYLGYSQKISAIDCKLGLRAEHTYAKGIQLENDYSFTNHYVDFFPTAYLAMKLKNRMQLIVGVSRRITRPQVEMINPFLRINSPLSISQGNPFLRPFYLNRIEAAINPIFKSYYSFGAGRPQLIRTAVPDGKMLSTYVNLSRVQNFGIDGTLSLAGGAFSVIRLPEYIQLASVSLSYLHVLENGNYSTSTLEEDYSTNRNIWKLNMSFSVRTLFDIQFSMFYRQTFKNSDNKVNYHQQSDLSCSFGYDLFSGNMNISLSGNDLLNSAKYWYSIAGSNYSNEFTQSPARSRSVNVNIMWRFNKYENRVDRNGEDERDRSGSFL